jgi:hypothetical protein
MQIHLAALCFFTDPPPDARWLKPIEWMTLIALIAGPMLAVGTQLFWQRRKEKLDQKRYVFGTLMSLRAAMLTPEFVRAFNYVDVVFYKNKEVRAKRKKLFDYLCSADWKVDIVLQTTLDTTKDLQAELLAEMAKDLGYQYDHTHIKQNAYYPKQFNVLYDETTKLRQLGIQLLEGQIGVNFIAREPRPPQAMQVGHKDNQFKK